MASYTIDSASDLESLAVQSGKFAGIVYKDNHFVLTTNIDISACDPSGDGTGWGPIGGSSDNPWNGFFDGSGHIISNLIINRPTANYLGLFGKLDATSDGATPIDSPIKNLKIIGINITGKDSIGGLASTTLHMLNTYPIKDIHVSGSIKCERGGGGLVEGANSSDFLNCAAHVTVSGNHDSNWQEIGGFIGQSTAGTVCDKCYSTGPVINLGLSGVNTDVGGFIGTAAISTMQSGCYWDTETSLMATSSGVETGKTTTQMQTQSTFTGWDFTNIWWMPTNNYPELRIFGGVSGENVVSIDYSDTINLIRNRILLRNRD